MYNYPLYIILQLLIDFGMVILIWTVQLVVYPSFLFYKSNDLKKFHPLYTQRISMVVMPLMVSQLAIHIFATYTDPNTCNFTNTALIVTMWLITFVWAVPLHQSIDKLDMTTGVCRKLIKVNWYRTIGWTIVFIISAITLTELS